MNSMYTTSAKRAQGGFHGAPARAANFMAIALFAALMLLGAAAAAYADGADPKTVTPAWVTEQQLAQQQAQSQSQGTGQAQGQAAAQAAQKMPPRGNSLFFIGYSYPTLSGPLASYLAPWNSAINFSLGIEAPATSGSSFLSGLELEFFATVNNQGMRLQMNDMVMLGYSLDLAKVARLNVGARLGLGLIDVTDDSSANDTYTAMGGLVGPEASLYGMVAKDFWIWARARYLLGYYFTIDSNGASPIDTGNTSLNCLSIEAGLAFRM